MGGITGTARAILIAISTHSSNHRHTARPFSQQLGMAAWYLQILWTHVGCVIASGSLFCTRGCMMLAGTPLVNHTLLRVVSVAIDMLLLAAAIALTMIIHQYPFVQAWLTVKVLLLVVYIVLGTFALKRGRSPAVRATCFGAAVAVFLFIISVAFAHDPLGVFAGL